MYAFYRKRLNVLDVLAPAPLDIKLHEGAVLELDADAFDLVVDGSRHVLVQFGAPWCGPCKVSPCRGWLRVHAHFTLTVGAN